MVGSTAIAVAKACSPPGGVARAQSRGVVSRLPEVPAQCGRPHAPVARRPTI